MVAIKSHDSFPQFTTIGRQFLLGLSCFCTACEQFLDCIIKDVSIVNVKLWNKADLLIVQGNKDYVPFQGKGQVCISPLKNVFPKVRGNQL